MREPEPWDLGLVPKPDDAPLRVLILEKADRASEAGQPRTPKQRAALTRLRTEMTKAGVLRSVEELQPSASAKRLLFTGNKLRVIDGPFSESKELIGASRSCAWRTWTRSSRCAGVTPRSSAARSRSTRGRWPSPMPNDAMSVTGKPWRRA